MSCERCAGEAPTAVYRLTKRGGSRQVNLCNPCRDVTALVHVLEAVGPRRAETRSKKAKRKKAKAPEAKAPETPKAPEAPEAEEPQDESERGGVSPTAITPSRSEGEKWEQ